VLDLLAAKVVDEADARVMLGLSSTRDEAIAYLGQRMATAAPAARLAGLSAGPSPFTLTRETSAGAAVTEDEE